MALSLLFGRKYRQASIAGVVLDAVVEEDHSYTARVSSFPIENNDTISDHIVNDPENLQISGVVSDTPLSFLAPFNRSVNAFQALIEVYNRKERVTVVTGIKIYTDMVMTSLQIPRSVQTGQSLTFNISLQKVLLDYSTRYTELTNSPFEKPTEVITRDQVAMADKYPVIQGDPVTSLKDQATSQVNAGVQELRSVSTAKLPRITQTIQRIIGS